MSNEVAGLDWSAERMIPAFQTPQHLDVYDIRGASHEVQLTITTLVGIVNRPQPRVYLITGDDDAFWLKEVFGSLAQTLSPATNNNALETLLGTYRSSIQGIIIYDPNLIDTVNIATTLAGQRDGIVVSPAQAQGLQHTHNLSVLTDLSTHQWRSRLQAYDWARQNLLGGASSRLVAGLNPTNVTGLRSFLVATRTFVYYLDSRGYLPDFSDGLLSERNLMQQILGTFSQDTVHLGWFIDESSGVKLASQVAIPVLATDNFTNLEVWSAVPPQSTAPSIQAVAPADASDTIYLSFTISDGDNLQYSQHRMLRIWRDSNRGSLPIGWTISPSLLHAAPRMAEYYMTTATSNDELIAGPSGAGYMFPSHWPAEQLSLFLNRTGQQMQAMNLTTLEVLDTDFLQSSGLPFVSDLRQTGMVFSDEHRQESYVQALVPFGLQGLLSGAGLSKVSWKKVDGVPFYQNLGLADTVDKTVKLIQDALNAHAERPLFLNVYMLAWTISPSDLKQVVERLGSGYKVVLPKTLLALLAQTIS